MNPPYTPGAIFSLIRCKIYKGSIEQWYFSRILKTGIKNSFDSSVVDLYFSDATAFSSCFILLTESHSYYKGTNFQYIYAHIHVHKYIILIFTWNLVNQTFIPFGMY